MKHRLLYFSVLAAIVWIAFGQVKDFSFLNFDDPSYVVSNPYVNSGLNSENLIWAFSRGHVGHWHPLSWISHMIDVELFGLNPAGHHLVNLLFHTFNVFLVFWLIYRLFQHGPVALFCSALFAVHPLRIESVVWVSERKDVLCLFFTLLVIHLYLFQEQRRSAARYLGIVFFLVCALMAKPMAVVLPVLLLTLDYWPLRRLSPRSIMEKLPLFILCLGSAAATFMTQQGAGAVATLGKISAGERLEMALIGWEAYLGKFFWPAGIGIFYPMTSYAPGIAAGAGMLFIGMCVLCWRERERRPYLLCGWVWFVAATLPIIGFIPVGGQTFADRWTYLPHVGLIIGLGGLVSPRLETASVPMRRIRMFCLSLPVLLLLMYTRVQTAHWRDTESVFRQTLLVSPGNFMAHTNLGAELSGQGRWEEAAYHYEEAARLNPTYPEALNNLGTLRAHQGRYVEAGNYFDRALQIRPSFERAQMNLNLLRQVNSTSCNQGNPRG